MSIHNNIRKAWSVGMSICHRHPRAAAAVGFALVAAEVLSYAADGWAGVIQNTGFWTTVAIGGAVIKRYGL